MLLRWVRVLIVYASAWLSVTAYLLSSLVTSASPNAELTSSAGRRDSACAELVERTTLFSLYSLRMSPSLSLDRELRRGRASALLGLSLSPNRGQQEQESVQCACKPHLSRDASFSATFEEPASPRSYLEPEAPSMERVQRTPIHSFDG